MWKGTCMNVYFKIETSLINIRTEQLIIYIYENFLLCLYKTFIISGCFQISNFFTCPNKHIIKFIKKIEAFI